VAPFAATQLQLWLTTACRFRVGRYPWSRWRVDAKGVPVTLLPLAEHPPDVGPYSTAALARIPLDAMVLAPGNIQYLLSLSRVTTPPRKKIAGCANF
jgi:hypothetical protein